MKSEEENQKLASISQKRRRKIIRNWYVYVYQKELEFSEDEKLDSIRFLVWNLSAARNIEKNNKELMRLCVLERISRRSDILGLQIKKKQRSM